MLCQRGEGFSVPLLSVFYTAASSFEPSVTGDQPAMREGNLVQARRRTGRGAKPGRGDRDEHTPRKSPR